MAADAANLSGERVKFGAVEQRLTDILSGGASLSQVPDTVRGQGRGRGQEVVWELGRAAGGLGTQAGFVPPDNTFQK